MYQSNTTVHAIRSIDAIFQMPTVNRRPSLAAEISADKDELPSKEDSTMPSSYQVVVCETSKVLEIVNTELSFRIYEEIGRPAILLIETGSNKVIREISPEKMLDIVAGIWEWVGLIVGRKE